MRFIVTTAVTVKGKSVGKPGIKLIVADAMKQLVGEHPDTGIVVTRAAVRSVDVD